MARERGTAKVGMAAVACAPSRSSIARRTTGRYIRTFSALYEQILSQLKVQRT